MSDLIRRTDAIKAVEDLPNAYNGWSDTYDKAYIIGTLEEVPSADRPQGEWLNYKDEHTCSVCKEVVIGDWYYEYEWYDFCPNCGARMKGADDEQMD